MDKLKLEKIKMETDEAIPYSLIENYIFDIDGLSANKKLLLLMFRRYCGANKKPAFPSYSKLMKDIGCNSTVTIMKGIDFFIWIHWLEKINRTADTKEKISNYYILSLKNIRLVLDHFNKKGYKFKDVEKYFEENYFKGDKNKKTKNIDFINSPCKFLE